MSGDEELVGVVARIAAVMTEAFRSGHKVLLCGNGGSAADAQHIAAELVGRFQTARQPLPAMSLGVNASTLTAIGNDFSFDDIFARQVAAFGTPGDILVGLSTSGQSENVASAVRAAKERGLTTVSFTGANGGKLAEIAEVNLIVPATNTARIQEAHITAAHIICELVEAAAV